MLKIEELTEVRYIPKYPDKLYTYRIPRSIKQELGANMKTYEHGTEFYMPRAELVRFISKHRFYNNNVI